jgi:hypothetical protein
VACGGAPDLAPCSGDVTVSVVRFDPPRLSWEPDCGLDILAVLDAADQPMWYIRTNTRRNSLASPVTYGVVPPGMVEEFTPREFQHGNGYVVRIYRYHREADGTELAPLAGQGNFRW